MMAEMVLLLAKGEPKPSEEWQTNCLWRGHEVWLRREGGVDPKAVEYLELYWDNTRHKR